MGVKKFLNNLAGGTIENKVRPTSCVQAAGFNAAHTTTSIATKGYGAIVFVLTIAADAAGPDWRFCLFESNVSVTDAGAQVAPEDVIVHGLNAAGTAFSDAKCPATTGLLTMNHNDDEALTWIFVYNGNAKWVRLQATVGTKTNIMAVTVIKTKAKAPLRWG